MREQAGAIRRELGNLNKDVERLAMRVGNLDRHFSQARRDVEEIKVSSEKAAKRAGRLHNFDFEDLADNKPEAIVPAIRSQRATDSRARFRRWPSVTEKPPF